MTILRAFDGKEITDMWHLELRNRRERGFGRVNPPRLRASDWPLHASGCRDAHAAALAGAARVTRRGRPGRRLARPGEDSEMTFPSGPPAMDAAARRGAKRVGPRRGYLTSSIVART